MPIAGPTRTPNDARSLEAGMLLIGAGAILLFISLFLEWYQPGIDAWEIFEVWDLVLALLAIMALVGLASRMGVGAPRPASWLIVPAIASLVIVLYAIINPPPLVPEIDGDPSTGLWLALAASVLMTVGALLSVARISVAINPADSLGGGHGASPAQPGGGHTGAGAAPVAGDPVDPGPTARPGTGIPPTEPTQRL